MQYLVPKELPFNPSPQEIEEIFPYSFAYFLLPGGRCCVARTTYLGKDYSKEAASRGGRIRCTAAAHSTRFSLVSFK